MNPQHSHWSYRGKSAPRNFIRNQQPRELSLSRNFNSAPNEQKVALQSSKRYDPYGKINAKAFNISDDVSSNKKINKHSPDISEHNNPSKNENSLRAPLVQQLECLKESSLIDSKSCTDASDQQFVKNLEIEKRNNFSTNLVITTTDDKAFINDITEVKNLETNLTKPMSVMCANISDNNIPGQTSIDSNIRFTPMSSSKLSELQSDKTDFNVDAKITTEQIDFTPNILPSNSTVKSPSSIKQTNDPPFQSQLMEKSGITIVRKKQINDSSSSNRDVPYDSFKKKSTIKWNKTDKPFRKSETAINPMEVTYEDNPNIDRSILEAEPENKIKKFSNKCRVFVGGLISANEKLLKDMFTKFGEISELWLNKEKGFGFVRLDYQSNVQRAIDHYNGMVRLNNIIRVRHAARSSSVKVSNLSFAVSNEHLSESFKLFGDVDHAVVACDDRGKSLGWGIVDFVTKKSALQAVARCSEDFFLLCKSPIPVFVSELKEEDIEEGFPEKTVPKHSLFHRERSEGSRFAMQGSFEYQYCLKWRSLFENEKSQRKNLDDLLKKNRVELESETEMQFVDYLQQQEHIRHQEELRRIEESKRLEDGRKQDQLRHQEMIKNESLRQSINTRMQEDVRKLEGLQSYNKFGQNDKFNFTSYIQDPNYAASQNKFDNKNTKVISSWSDYNTNVRKLNAYQEARYYGNFGEHSPDQYRYDDSYETSPSKNKTNSASHQTSISVINEPDYLHYLPDRTINYNSTASIPFLNSSDPSGYGLDYSHYNSNRSIPIDNNQYSSINNNSNYLRSSKQHENQFSLNLSKANQVTDSSLPKQLHLDNLYSARNYPSVYTAYDRRRPYLSEWNTDHPDHIDKRRKN